MKLETYSVIVQPNHIETVIAEVDIDGEPHLVKLSGDRRAGAKAGPSGSLGWIGV